MRRTIALGCGALYLVFGFLAGLAHVHGPADHHQESRGLHLDHGHLSESGDHDLHHDRRHGHSHGAEGSHEEPIETRHAHHHDGDAIHLNATTARTLDSNPRMIPAIVLVGTVIVPPSSSSDREETLSRQPRDPPRKIPPRLRAPPA